MTLDELTRLYEAVTKGEWKASKRDRLYIVPENPVRVTDNHAIALLYLRADGGQEEKEANAEWIPAIHNAFPNLRDELLALRAENAKLWEALQEWSDYFERLERNSDPDDPLVKCRNKIHRARLNRTRAALTKGQANG